jgi:hypothetical protein
MVQPRAVTVVSPLPAQGETGGATWRSAAADAKEVCVRVLAGSSFLAEADPSGPGLYGDAPLIPPTDASEPL